MESGAGPRPHNPRREARQTESRRGSAHNQLLDLSLGTQARRRKLQKSHDGVIRVYDESGNVIETHESHRRWRLKFFENFASQFP